MKRVLAVLLTVLMMSLVLAACGSDSSSTPASESASEPASTPESVADASEPASQPEETHDPVNLMLAAAASLKDSFDTTLIPMFQEQYDWITVTGTYDSSGKLQTQIEEGLAADVFMSAATKQMTALTDSGMIDAATVVDLLENEIVLIAPIDSGLAITAFEDIVNAETIALGDPASVPAGQYAEEALTTLGLWDAVQAKTVSLGTNVTEVLNQVAEGSADVGIVYATDAAQMPEKVKVLASAPEGSLEKKVIYPVGILAQAPQCEAAELFLEFLQSPAAMDVFIANGFKSNIGATAS